MGEPIAAQLWYFSRGGDGGGVAKNEELERKWFGGPGESQNGPGMALCSSRYEAKGIVHALKKQTGTTLPANSSAGKAGDPEEAEVQEALTEAERKWAVEEFEKLDRGGVCQP